MPKRLNRAIELLEQGQPVYYTGAPEVSYEGGREMAATWADYIAVDMEHGAFDMTALGEFMRGLADAGPTRSGHRTPPVIVSVPTEGSSEQIVRTNAWMFKQVLARGVHGIILCHAENPEAVRTFVESCRYPFNMAGVGQGLNEGRRGSAGQASAAAIWGVPVDEYLRKADVWPLNPEGEIMLGIKIENSRALVNAEMTATVSGIAFGEWGPGDMGMSLGHPDAHDPPYPEEMAEARSRVMAACREAGLFFLNGVNPDSVVEMIDEGVMIGSCGQDGEEATVVGRAHTGRTMPV